MRAAVIRVHLCLSAVSFLFAVDGTVVNKTTGKPQPGATVTLYQLAQAEGMNSIESVKSDGQGKFKITQDVQGPRLIQAAFDGVTYNHMLPPGAPATGITVDVYNASSQPGAAAVAQHMMLFEPSGGQMMVSESYIWRNDGKTTYNDPDGGTLKFYLSESAKGVVQVNATAPQGMPIQRAAEKTAKPGVYKIDFPIKPGETRIDLTYMVPASGSFEGKILYKGGPTRLVAPVGVTLKGDAIESVGQEPRTQATIYNVKGTSFHIQIEGSGSLRAAAESAASEDAGPSIEQIMPKVFAGIDGSAGIVQKLASVKWILLLSFGVLALGFLLLYRAQPPAEQPAPKEANERRRR